MQCSFQLLFVLTQDLLTFLSFRFIILFSGTGPGSPFLLVVRPRTKLRLVMLNNGHKFQDRWQLFIIKRFLMTVDPVRARLLLLLFKFLYYSGRPGAPGLWPKS